MMKKILIMCGVVLVCSQHAFANELKIEKSKQQLIKKDTIGSKAKKSLDAKIDKKSKGDMIVEMKTSHGSIKIQLFPKKSPISVANFLKYVDQKFYDNTIFHRVMSNFMVQGGGFKIINGVPELVKTNAPIINEARNGLSNTIGTLAMARKPINPQLGWKDSTTTTSQFFINHQDNSGTLDYKGVRAVDSYGYAVFAKVISGMEVVNKIKSVPVGVNKIVRIGPNNQKIESKSPNMPNKHVIIHSIRRMK